MEKNFQMNTWTSDFGKEYTDRNIFSPEDLDQLDIQRFGVTRTYMVKEFLNDLNIFDKRILEVGCNVGNELRFLQREGYKSLYGIEIQHYAVEKAKNLTNGINIIQGSADDLPFKDKYFDLVFTAGVLIHISPKDIEKIIDEIYRCSKNYIWGLEYYADQYTEVVYRGQKNLLWKTDFAQLYLDRFPDLKLIKKKNFKYIENQSLEDCMFLLKKTK